MTNSELLAANKTLLTGLDSQRRFILEMASVPMTCPHCGKGTSLIAAYGDGTVDAYPIGKNTADNEYHCPHCETQLHYCVPVIGSTFWMT